MVAELEFPGLRNNGRPFISPHTRIGLMVYPQPPWDDVFVPPRMTTAIDLGWDLDKAQASSIQFGWNKQMGQPAGSWNAVVKQKYDGLTGRPYLELGDQAIVDGDWVDITIRRNGVPIPLCRGVVDTVREQKTSAGGATVATYTLTGRDHGAFFDYPITWNNIYIRTLGEYVGGLFQQRVEGKVGGRPDELFKALIEATFVKGTVAGPWEIPPALAELTNTESLFDLLKIVPFRASKYTDGLRGAYYNEPQLWTTGGQTLHQTLAEWTNPMLNEYWYDLLPPGAFMPKHGLNAFLSGFSLEEGLIGTGLETLKGPSIEADHKNFGTLAAFIRERPFPSTIEGKDSMWSELPTWIIPTWLIADSDLGRGGAQRYNLFELLADFGLGPQAEQAMQAKPVWHPSSIRTHGLRTYQQHTKFYAQDAGGIGSWMGERERWQRLLVDWFSPNPFFIQGTITTKVVLPEIRIGHRVILAPGDDPNQWTTFYVEGTNHGISGTAEPATPISGNSVFVLTRGFKGSDEELLSMVEDTSSFFEEVF